MNHSEKIGKIHLGFFDHSHVFKRLRVSRNEKGEVEIQSPFFAMKYNFDSGTLYGDDKDVILDFADLIAANYGTNVTREQFSDKLSWNKNDDNHSVLNVGVCILSDSILGWDGTINSVWYDAEAPGTVVSINFQYWTTRMLNGAWKLNQQDVLNLGGPQVVLPNLLDAVNYVGKTNLNKVNALLSEIK